MRILRILIVSSVFFMTYCSEVDINIEPTPRSKMSLVHNDEKQEIEIRKKLKVLTKKLNDIQVIGSHNSYKRAVEKPILDSIAKIDNLLKLSLEYEHIALNDQLELGLRSLEYDVFFDPIGGRYSNPAGLKIVLEAGICPLPFDIEKKLNQPGLKMFHAQDVDFRSSHLLFKDGLKELKIWSDQNPTHTSIIVLINAKDDQILNTTIPLPFTADALESIDMEIRSIFSNEQLITPDLVKGEMNFLENAILTNGWPEMEDMKGKILFILDENKNKTQRYLTKFPGLENAVMFANLEKGNNEAAFMVINDPILNFDKINNLVNLGYMVRTRADSDTKEARIVDYERFVKAQASGAQVISTDYYIPSALFNSNYKIIFEDGSYERIKD